MHIFQPMYYSCLTLYIYYTATQFSVQRDELHILNNSGPPFLKISQIDNTAKK